MGDPHRRLGRQRRHADRMGNDLNIIHSPTGRSAFGYDEYSDEVG